jgi:hypothetical protein
MAAIFVLIHGAIHLQQYVTGFSQIPVVGWLFLLNAVAAVGVAALLLTRTSLGVAGAVLLSAGSLVALAMARTIGLFGYASTTFGAPELIAVVAEVATLVVLLVAYVRSSRSLSTFATA